MSLPPLPASLKPVQHYLKTANEHDQRDPTVAYYCRLYAVQRGMQLDKKSPDSKEFLFKVMDLLEQSKQAMKDNEALTNEVVGQAHLENYALKVFLFADNEDRAGRFSKNVVKSFYTAGMLFDVLSVFGELSEDIQNNQKYSKWKATYIHNCLKNGIQPHAGPLPEEGEEGEDVEGATGGPGLGFSNVSQPGPSYNERGSSSSTSHHYPTAGAGGGSSTGVPYQPQPPPAAGTHAPSNTPAVTPTSQPYQPQPAASTSWTPQPGAVQLTSEQNQRAMKLCKFAGSALQYEDSATAIDNLQKALRLLTTGKE